ncbi:MAG: energy transducer TonB [Candidatus Margulisbacteria bacterium]|nr:energy transducer TonB [Candidatus Margulisiibacteriota bacterium]MBU1021052.1 energy transducer TonB [Candidatus Margulisiibacteriota bacterium]MBU1729727.1 energy transducer TonB [Candidatus Margulisiibacteriota bacterium]MBU1955992.1 energy transducer TonB [Candidatus Margulisiibacteriota bacterium]
MRTNKLNWIKISIIDVLILAMAVIAFFAIQNVTFTTKAQAPVFTYSEVIVQPVTKPAAKVISIAKPIAASVQPSAPVAKPLPIMPPQLIKQVLPVYPESAVKEGIEGVVTLNLIIGKDGKVVESQVKSSSGSESLDLAASQAASKWVFVPAKQSEAAVLSHFEVPITFKLKG